MSPVGRIPQPRDPCGFGVSRHLCHVGCGRRCRHAGRRFNPPQPTRAELLEMPAEELDALRTTGIPPVPAVGCCGGCDLPPGHKPCSL